MTSWPSDFLVDLVIQMVNGFLFNQINPKVYVPQGSFLRFFSLLFLIYVNELPTPHHKQNSLPQFAGVTAQWAFSLNVHFAAVPSKFGNVECQIENHTESPKKQGDHILQVKTRQKNRTQSKTIWLFISNFP